MLELQTFGGLELRTETGEAIEGLAGRTKCLALLAYLAVEAPDGRVPREQVAALLWPGGTDERARASLRAALSQIRHATGPVLVAGEGTSRVGLVRDHLRADVTAFREALEAGEAARALEIYGGDFLAGVRVQGAGRFQRWADRKRGHLRQLAYEAALSVGAGARAADDLTSAEVAYRRALSLAPLREEAAEKLLRTLADRGRAADAVQLYETFRARREAKLEMAPSEELDAWVERLKQAPPAASGAAEEGEPGGEVRGPETGGSAAEALDVRPSPDTDVPAGATVSRWGPFRRRALLGALVAVVLVGAALAGAWQLVGPGGEAAAVAAGDRSVAVLPFEATGTEDPGPIAAGLHSDLLTRLSAVGDLKVISSTSVERFREADLPLPAIADSLGVTWVLEGHVQRAGAGIEVHAQLIDPRTDTHAWAETYRRELTAENLFELQSDITRRIARSLEAELTPGEQERVERRPTPDLEAYRLYVQGRRHLSRRSAAGAREAVRYFRQAVERDSAFALAWTGLADLASLADVYGWDLPRGSLPDPHEAARRALQLAPNLAEAHAALGRLAMDYRGKRDAPAAYRALRRAIDLKPSYAEAHHGLGHLELAFGDLERAVDLLTTAVNLDPGLSPAWGTLAWTEFARGQPVEALSYIERELADRRGLAEDELGHMTGLRDRAIAFYHQGRYTDARRIARRWFGGEEGTQPVFGMLLVAVEAATGDTARAESALARMKRQDAPPVLLGVARAALGDVDGAYEAFLRDEVLWPHGTVILLRHWFPTILAAVQTDPRYPELVRQIERSWKLEPTGSFTGLNDAR